MVFIKKIFQAVFILVCSVSVLQAQLVNVIDFGVKPNSFGDATPGVQQAIAACKGKPGATLVFPQGRYDFWPEKAERREYFISNTSTESECPSKIKTIGLLFENMNDLTIDGNNSLFVFHGKMITFAFSNCNNIKLQNVSEDFERPSMSELTFLDVKPNEAIVSINPASTYSIIDEKLVFYGEGWRMNDNFSILIDTVSGTNIYSSFGPVQNSKAVELAPYRIKLTGDFRNTNYKPGSILTIRDPIRDQVGMFINLSKNIQLHNVNMHYMHGLGIISQFSEDLKYTKVNITPSKGRAVASFADGMHFSGCKGKIEIDSCRFKGLHDDPINVHGTYLQITKVNSPTQLVVKFMHGQTYGFSAFFENDSIALIHSRMLKTAALGKVKSAKLISEREMLIDMEAPFKEEIKQGDCLENITWTPSLEVRNSRFESTNTRGLLVTTPKKVVIENNHFYRTGMYAIQIACDAGSWYESGAVNDVLIRHNIFEDCVYNFSDNSYAIALVPENHEEAKDYWVHRNIHIKENVFKVFDDLLVRAKSTQGLFFENNTVEHSSFVSPIRKGNTNKQPSFRLENCTKVVVKNNNYKLNEPVVLTECIKMKKQDITAEKKCQLVFN